MSNPWEKINLSDYENHMSLDTVYQLQALSEMMHEQFYTYDVNSIMILGIADIMELVETLKNLNY